MAEEKPAITTQTTQREPRTIQTGGPSATSGVAQDNANEQKVSVIPLGTFHKEENMQGDVVRPGDPAFEVTRMRAAQLRANGLIRYANESDEKAIHGDRADALRERVERDAESRKIPDQHKSTPPRNPEVKLADLPSKS